MRGFSLLETTVAIAILIVAILGPLSVATYSLSRAGLSENEIIAYNLAEEALEFVINTRDSNVFAGNNWLSGLDDGGNQCDGFDGCYIDVTNTADPVKDCTGSCSGDLIRRNATSGLYTHNAADTATIFKRRIFLRDNNLQNNDERIVEVRITWSERFLPNKSFIIEHHIFEKE